MTMQRLFGNNVPGHTTRAPPVGFEPSTNGFQFNAIANFNLDCRLGSLDFQCFSGLSRRKAGSHSFSSRSKMPLTWSRGSTAGAISARHTFLALIPPRYHTNSSVGRSGSTKSGTAGFDSISPSHSTRRFNTCGNSKFVFSPYMSIMTETKVQRRPGWAGGPSFYVPAKKTYGRTLMQSPYLSTVQTVLPVRSSGFLGDFPRTPIRSPIRSPRSNSGSPPRSPKSAF